MRVRLKAKKKALREIRAAGPTTNWKKRRNIRAIRQAEYAEKQLTEQGADLIASTPEEFDAYLKSETVKWGKVIRAAGIQPN